jgi:hypothetical protein
VPGTDVEIDEVDDKSVNDPIAEIPCRSRRKKGSNPIDLPSPPIEPSANPECNEKECGSYSDP